MSNENTNAIEITADFNKELDEDYAARVARAEKEGK